MENENTTANTHEFNRLEVSDEAQSYLWETRKWARFFGILGFVIVGLVAVFAVCAGVFSSRFETLKVTGFKSWGITVFYLLVCLLYFFPSLYIYRFARFAKSAILNKDGEQLNVAFKNLSANFRFMGVLSIIVISIYILVFAAMFAVGLQALFG